MPMNLFDEWANIGLKRGAANNESCALSSVGQPLRLSTAGWWDITVSGDAWVVGPEAASTVVTSTTGHVMWSQEHWLVYVPVGVGTRCMNVLGKGVTGQKAYAGRIKDA